MKVIEVVADHGHQDTLLGLADQLGASDFWYSQSPEGERQSFRMLVNDEKRQAMLDALQNLLGASENTRILVLPVEASLPRPKQDEKSKNKKSINATREELYSQVAKNVLLDTNFIILVILSTVVAAIGLLENNVAVIVGAMVIAPLLGPNIALAFAATLGDRELMKEAFQTGLTGLVLALVLSMIIGWVWPVVVLNTELMSRTYVGFDDVALALASGAAAVLSLTSGVSSALVGVMVAVALLPPTATLGMLVVSGYPEHAAGAALLLAVNVVSVNLAANLVFLFKGVRPRTWLEKRTAKQSAGWVALFWAMLLLLLSAALYVRELLK